MPATARHARLRTLPASDTFACRLVRRRAARALVHNTIGIADTCLVQLCALSHAALVQPMHLAAGCMCVQQCLISSSGKLRMLTRSLEHLEALSSLFCAMVSVQALEYPEKIGILSGIFSGITVGSANGTFMLVYALVSLVQRTFCCA